MYRTYKDESELKALAEERSKIIVIRTYDERGNSSDVSRPTTAKERKILTSVIYGALLAANYYREATNECAILTTAEFTAQQLIKDINTYDSIYTPLKNVFRYWELCNQ